MHAQHKQTSVYSQIKMLFSFAQNLLRFSLWYHYGQKKNYERSMTIPPPNYIFIPRLRLSSLALLSGIPLPYIDPPQLKCVPQAAVHPVVLKIIRPVKAPEDIHHKNGPHPQARSARVNSTLMKTMYSPLGL